MNFCSRLELTTSLGSLLLPVILLGACVGPVSSTESVPTREKEELSSFSAAADKGPPTAPALSTAEFRARF